MNQRVRWWQGARSTAIGLTFIAVLLLCSFSACADVGGIQGDGNTAPLAAPTATPKGPTIPQTSAVLGGSVFAFDKRFGANNCCYDNGWTYQGAYSQMWTGVYIGSAGSLTSVGERSTQRVVGIENAGPMVSDMSWTMGQAKAICGSFIPPDAKYQGSSQVNTHSLIQGFELRYTSASLANTLPSNAFKDVNGKPTAPGMLYVFYDYGLARSTDTIRWCRVGTDEHWTLFSS